MSETSFLTSSIANNSEKKDFWDLENLIKETDEKHTKAIEEMMEQNSKAMEEIRLLTSLAQ